MRDFEGEGGEVPYIPASDQKKALIQDVIPFVL